MDLELWNITMEKKHQKQVFQISHFTNICAGAREGALMCPRSDTNLEAEVDLEEKKSELKLGGPCCILGKSGTRCMPCTGSLTPIPFPMF